MGRFARCFAMTLVALAGSMTVAAESHAQGSASVKRVIYLNVNLNVATNTTVDRFVNFTPAVNPEKCLAEVVGGPFLLSGSLSANTAPPLADPFITSCQANRVLIFTGALRNSLSQFASGTFLYSIRITEFN